MQSHSNFRFWLQALSILPCIFQTSRAYNIRRRGLSLAILPLGDSITFGTDSTDGNGYRLDLENLLVPANSIEFIGSVMQGSMTDNDNEGHPGFTITEIAAEAPQDFSKTPNVVLLMAGTNDVIQDLDLSNAPARLGTLIDALTGNLTESTIIVATLTPLANATQETRREAYNAAIPGLIKERADAGKRVTMVDMTNVTISEIATADGIHPDDEGYATMAQVWYGGIMEAAGKGLIVNGSSNATTTNSSDISSKISSSSTSTSSSAAATTTAKSLAISLSPPAFTLPALAAIGFLSFVGL